LFSVHLKQSAEHALLCVRVCVFSGAFCCKNTWGSHTQQENPERKRSASNSDCLESLDLFFRKGPFVWDWPSLASLKAIAPFMYQMGGTFKNTSDLSHCMGTCPRLFYAIGVW